MMILSSSRLIHASSGGIRFVQPTAETQQETHYRLKLHYYYSLFGGMGTTGHGVVYMHKLTSCQAR